MPAGDRTGPEGRGSMTGRGAGFCAGYRVAGYMNPAPGRGYSAYGRGFGGRGRGRRNWYYATGQPGWARAAAGLPAGGAPGPYSPQQMSPQEKAEALKEESGYLKEELKDIEKQIKALQKESKDS
ncbi:MAG: DUF5320 domain-containing protein [Elusimicrobiota bacterium]